MLRFLPLAAAAACLVGSGLLCGLHTNRWGQPVHLQAAAGRLDAVASDLGDWQGAPFELDARQLQVAEVIGYLARRYVHRWNGNEITVLIVCGRPGPLAVHTPDVCFRGVGYGTLGDPQKHPITDVAAVPDTDFWTVQFAKQGPAPEVLRVFWAWSDDGTWHASDAPRITFARSDALYKLYVIHRSSRQGEPIQDDPCLEFFRVLLPELQKRLSPSA
jgi:hypothetical protein